MIVRYHDAIRSPTWNDATNAGVTGINSFVIEYTIIPCPADTNDETTVDFNDLLTLLDNFAVNCG